MSTISTRIYGSPGTLYARCGGIFGISSFVDRCMDLWMANPTLNENQMVARWHASAQRPGFKFLVVQIVCSLTGGPQHYTGRPMDEAHKHLNISLNEWDAFMQIFNEVCDEFHLPSEDQDDLNALMISMMDDCVVFPGERPRRDPGQMRPGGNSLYARVGGVYPLALFVDRLVDALLADERVAIPTDGTKRNEASLKYLTTEMACKIASGPEAVTCVEAEETKLLVPRSAWPIVMLTARLAADHLEARQRDALLAAFDKGKEYFIDPHSKDGPLPGGAANRRAATVKTKETASWDGNKLLSKAVINARHTAVGASVAARKRVYGDPRTLYGKGGGVFGLAKLAHELMEAWMADPTLNDNAMVARWHESQQKAGFKFLVTQIMGYMTGGPQRYTGRPMEDAHRHLAIKPAEWQVFMDVADATFERIAVPAAARRELREILSGFEQQCTLPPGQRAPPDPGAPRPHPSTVGTAFHRLGGVYPIAAFADRLVDSLMTHPAGRAIGVQFDALDDPDARRHPSGLKYLLTELLCSAAGGQEVVTAKGFADAKLGVPAAQWGGFCALATEVATVFPTSHHRAMVLAIVNEVRAELCIGLDANQMQRNTPVKRLEGAGFERFDAIAALAQRGGDYEQAADLLLTGWRPEGAQVDELRAMDTEPEAPRCPFGFGGGAHTAAEAAAPTAEAPRCPFGFDGRDPPAAGRAAKSAKVATPSLPEPLAETVRTMAARAGMGAEQIAQTLNLDVAAVVATLSPASDDGGAAPLPPGLADAARTMAERGIQLDQIAEMLKVDVESVKATVEPATGCGVNGMYKALGDEMQQRLDALLEEEPNLCCPVTLVLLLDPVTAKDGFIYERSAAEALCTGEGGAFVSPMTRESLPADFVLAAEMRERSLTFRRQRAAAMLTFAEEAAPTRQEMVMSVIDRVSEYLAAMPAEAVAMLALPTIRACDELLKTARTTDQPTGVWHAKPQQLRRVNALKLQVTAGGGADLRQLTCLVCFDDFPALKGLECAAGDGEQAGGSEMHAKIEKHFVCEECLAGHVSSSVDAESIELFTRHGGVRCVHPQCQAPPFADGMLARALPADVFTRYTAAKEKVAEQRINAELEAGFEQRLKVEREKAGVGNLRQETKAHIVEKILTLSCPRCSQAFVDFNGCMALTCSRAGCGCGFCALCQQDCGHDAHGHVGGGCPLASKIGVRRGEFHLSEAEYNKATAKARALRLKEYLETLTTARKQHALEDCERELRDLGLNPADLHTGGNGGGHGGGGRLLRRR